MLKLKNVDWKKGGIFAAGVLFGTAGIKALSSDDAKKLYTNCTAADILAEAQQINEEREAAAEAAMVADAEAVEAAADTAEETEA